MSTFLESLEAYLRNTSKEQIQKDWAEFEECDKVGPTVESFIQGLDPNPKTISNFNMESEAVFGFFFA